MRSDRPHNVAGFSLIETLVASALIAAVLVGLAQLVASAARQSLRSRQSAAAVAVVQGKLEELRNLPWKYDHTGAPVSGTALATSPAGALTADTPGYVDYVGSFGEVVPSDGPELPEFARRWSIEPFGSGADTLLFHVCAFMLRGRTARDELPAACGSAIRTRKP